MSGRLHRAGFVFDFVSATQRLVQRNRVGKPLRLCGDQPSSVLLHLLPGKQIGALLDQIAEAQAAGEVANRDEALELAARLAGI